jgi:hypothetical protein
VFKLGEIRPQRFRRLTFLPASLIADKMPSRSAVHAAISAAWRFSSGFAASACSRSYSRIAEEKYPSQVDFRSPESAIVSRNSPTGRDSLSARFTSIWAWAAMDSTASADDATSGTGALVKP